MYVHCLLQHTYYVGILSTTEMPPGVTNKQDYNIRSTELARDAFHGTESQTLEWSSQSALLLFKANVIASAIVVIAYIGSTQCDISKATTLRLGQQPQQPQQPQQHHQPQSLLLVCGSARVDCAPWICSPCRATAPARSDFICDGSHSERLDPVYHFSAACCAQRR